MGGAVHGVAAPAAEDILKLVPDSAFGFLAINQPAAVDAKFQTLARQVRLPAPSPLAMLKQFGMGEGLDVKGMAAMLVLPPQGDNPLPTPILLVPVTDYGKFRGQFQPESTADAVTKMHAPGQTAGVGPRSRRICRTDRRLTPRGGGKNLAARQGTSSRPGVVAKMARPERRAPVVVLSPGVKQLRPGEAGDPADERVDGQIRGERQGGRATQGNAAVFDVYVKITPGRGETGHRLRAGLQLDKQGVLRVVSRTSLVPGGRGPGFSR